MEGHRGTLLSTIGLAAPLLQSLLTDYSRLVILKGQTLQLSEMGIGAPRGFCKPQVAGPTPQCDTRGPEWGLRICFSEFSVTCVGMG